ncbi:MAG: gfo/Idh/MocA family oxidoreductase, partial [Bacteroidota bacterium]|nr:gfo/Idh/MocA family oxidoreductase [Bacteroidota bacterium]
MKEQKGSADPSRRAFVKNSAAALAAFYIVPRHVLGKGLVAPSDTLYIATIGAGGK